MNKQTLSVWTLNYNHGRYIQKSIESVLNQNRKPDEYIISDDGSTDESVSIIQETIKNDCWVNFYQQPKNLGCVENVKFCLEKSKKNFTYGISSDDYILPGWLDAAMKMADQYPQAGMIVGETEVRGVNGISGYDRVEAWDKAQYISPERFLNEYLLDEKKSTLLICSCIYNREIFESVGGFPAELPRYNDWWAFMACGLKAGLCYVPMPAHSIMINSGNNYAAALAGNSKFYISILRRFKKRAERPEFTLLFPKKFLKTFIKKRISMEIKSTFWVKYLAFCKRRDVYLNTKPQRVKNFAKAISGLLRCYYYLAIYWTQFIYPLYKNDQDHENLEYKYSKK